MIHQCTEVKLRRKTQKLTGASVGVHLEVLASQDAALGRWPFGNFSLLWKERCIQQSLLKEKHSDVFMTARL